MAKSIISYLGIKPGDTLLDYGAARGYLVKCMVDLGVDAYGYDISEWAVENCHPDVVGRMSNDLSDYPGFLQVTFNYSLTRAFSRVIAGIE